MAVMLCSTRSRIVGLVAKRILNADGKDSAAVNTAEVAAMAQLQRFATGMQLRGAAVSTEASNLAVSRPGSPRSEETIP